MTFMHELSIAESVLNEVIRIKDESALSRIKSIRLTVGKLSSVNIDALKEALSIVTKGTFLENAVFIIEEVFPKVRCARCLEVYDFGSMECPKCHSIHKEIVSGQELAISSIEGDT